MDFKVIDREEARQPRGYRAKWQQLKEALRALPAGKVIELNIPDGNPPFYFANLIRQTCRVDRDGGLPVDVVTDGQKRVVYVSLRK
jgi:hypothetical protein